MLLANNVVLNFIKDFKNLHQTEIEDTFLNGYCYWFAFILKSRFGGDIMYDCINNHFVTEIGDCLYDISGQVYGSFVYWDIYQRQDELEKQRIYRDCIYKIRRDNE